MRRTLILMSLLALAVAGCGSGQTPRYDPDDGGGNGGNFYEDVAPAGTIVYTRDGDIWRMDRRGGNQRRLTTASALDFQPCLTPDRRWIVFTSKRDGDYQLYRMRPDGRHLEQISDGRGFAADPAIAPDGSEIAFVSDRDGNDELYAMEWGSGRTRRITRTPDASEQTPAYSPDGRWLAFAATPSRTENTDIYVCNSNHGGDLIRLTAHPASDDSPTWSVDGQWVAFASDRGRDFDIYATLSTGAEGIRQLTNAVGDEGAPVYSADGRFLLFDMEREGDSDIVRLDLSSGSIEALTRSYSPETNPDTRAAKALRDGSRLLKGSRKEHQK